MRRALALSLALAACGSSRARPTEPPELFDLSEARALEIVGEVLSEEGVAPGAAWSVQLGAGARLDVDVRLASSSFGIEWISPQDRADLGDAVPGPTPDGRLRIVPGAGTTRAPRCSCSTTRATATPTTATPCSAARTARSRRRAACGATFATSFTTCAAGAGSRPGEAHVPVKRGLRFSANAAIASRRSFELSVRS